MSFALGLISYFWIVYAIKAATYPIREEPLPSIIRWKKGHEFTILFSLDFWLANCYKNRIKQFDEGAIQQCLSRYIKSNNRWNVWLSLALLAILVLFNQFSRSSIFHETVACACVIRYISRSYEISYAFGRDVLQEEESTSGLNKYDRVRLALWSYLEIFVYSAAAYLAVYPSLGALLALSMSLRIGTLTDIGVAFNSGLGGEANLIFVQVFCTLSLVVLSLASYLSRKK
jgi:hypothetical protein